MSRKSSQPIPVAFTAGSLCTQNTVLVAAGWAVADVAAPPDAFNTAPGGGS